MKSENLSGAKKLLIILCFLMYLFYGLYFGGFGANSGSMMKFFGIGESRQGMIMTVQSVGGIVMAVLLGIAGERINKLKGLLYGLIVMGLAGVLIGTIPSYSAAGTGYATMLCYSVFGGIGYITIDLLMNGAVADVFRERKTTFLPYVHAFFGAGSMLAPLFVSFLADPSSPASFSRPYMVIGVFSLLLGVVTFFAVRRVTPETPYADMAPIRARASANPLEVFKDIRAWQFFLCCFLYLCFQTGLVAWLPRFFEVRLGAPYETANTMLTLYFLGALVIRLISPAIYRRMPVKRYYLLSIGASVIVFAVFLIIPSQSLMLRRIMLVVTGLLQGIAVPSLQLLVTDTFADRTASASSAIVLGVSLSALLAPLIMGAIIESAGYMAAMWFITAALLLSAVVLLTVRNRQTSG
ncbi:MAG: MFS transporter [Oscillospiraceae bacterium]|nr:MFS transporter [Oscillospiraceae bacterium]